MSPQGEAVLSTNCALGDGGADVPYHRRVVIRLSHVEIHSIDTRMGCHYGVVLKRQDAFAQ